MKKKILYTIASAVLFMFTSTTSAQELRSGYFMNTATYSHQINPALLNKSYIGMPILGNLNIGTTGNIGLSNFIYKLEGNPLYKNTTFMNPNISANEFLGGLNDKNRINASINMSIASVAFKGFGGTNLIEINLHSNTSMNLPYGLFEFMKTTGAKKKYELNDICMRTQNYAELALGHSRTINEYLTVGSKIKVLFGIAYADFDVEKMEITMDGDQWRINSEANLEANILQADFEYEDYDPATSQAGRNKIKNIDTDDLSFNLPGFGLALDLGATYKMPTVEGLTLSASITDLGFISWKDTKKASSKGDYTFDGFDNPIYASGTNTGDNKLSDQWDAVSDDLEKMFSVYEDEPGKTSTSLATTLNFGAEYVMPFYNKLTAGFLFTSRLNGIYSWHQAMISANYHPIKWFEMNLNTSLTSTGMCFGGMISLHTKGFNFFIGSDRFIGSVSKEFIPLNNFNSNFCMGINFPLSSN